MDRKRGRTVPLRRATAQLAFCLALALLLTGPVASAQTTGQTVHDPAFDGTLRVPAGTTQREEGAFAVYGLDGNHTLVLDADTPALSGWNITVLPAIARMTGDDTVVYTISVEAGDDPRPREFDLGLRLRLLDDDGRTVTEETTITTVTLVGAQQILGIWDNPLPPPLDGAWGAFLGNLVAWLVISGLVALLIDPALRAVTGRTKTEVDDHIIHILRFPVFLVLFAFGAKQSLEVFDLPLLAFTILDRVYLVLLVVAIVYTAYRVWQEVVLTIGRRMARSTESKLDDRLLPVFEKTGGIIIVLVGLFYTLDALGINMTVFAAGGAITGLVIAFAAQDTLSNFFSGIFLMIDQPFKEGEDIILDTGEVVEVTHIGLRTTELYHRANHETIIIPNNLLATNRTINLLKPDNKYKVRIDVGVAYGSDVQLVKRLLLDIVRDHPLTLKDPDHEPFVRFQAFGASSLDFSVHGWVGDVYERWLVASDIREMIDERFAAHHIEIPFPQRVVWQGSEEAAKLDEARATQKAEGHDAEDAVQGHTHDQARHEVGGTSETGGDPGGSAEGAGGGDEV